jgi:hypothetical protein
VGSGTAKKNIPIWNCRYGDIFHSACHLINENQYNGCGLIDTIMISNLTIHYSATSKDLQQIKIKKSCKTGMQNTSTKISGLNWPIINKRKGDLISLQANGKWKTLLEKLFVSFFFFDK